MPDPPDEVIYTLDEALRLLEALEDANEVIAGSDFLAVVAFVEEQIVILARKLGLE